LHCPWMLQKSNFFLCVCMCLAQMLTIVHCPSTNTFGLVGFERDRT
jgi:predicted small integral membrane protein